MGLLELKPDDFYMEVVFKDSASIFSSFSCGNEEIDKYFRTEAINDTEKVCYAYRCKRDESAIGFATLCCSGININDLKLVKLAPAMKIDYFAVSERYQDMRFPGSNEEDHFYISDAFLCELIRNAVTISESYVGAGFIILYSVPDAVHFYERNGLETFEEFMKPENERYLEGCTPMYMPL